ncbi:hypothetical protein DHB64_10970 [Antarcticibacterium sp. W02-3]|nr:hypothetical protein [Antarcticibacterium sp. W02-3]
MVLLGCSKKEHQDFNKATVYIDKTSGQFRLIRKGEPFYIKGGATSRANLNSLREAGGNTARIYDTVNLKEVLNEAHALGLAVVVDIPLPTFKSSANFYEDGEYFDLARMNIEQTVRLHRDHPALLYWNLGNELYYPYFYKNTNFFERFNELISLIKGIDPNHPVSTTTIGANKLRVLSIHRKSPQLDFISFNSFGTLSQFSSKLKPISSIWTGPHVTSEWGVNGYWETGLTAWGAPVEETSTKKAELIEERYHSYIAEIKKENSFGSFVFYWGYKDEATPTWFSLFGKNGERTESVLRLENIWKETSTLYPGPVVNYLILEGKGAMDNIILPGNQLVEAEIVLPEVKEDYSYNWEVRYESWNELLISRASQIDFFLSNNRVKFLTPIEEGPYRLFVTIGNNSDYIATANIPFYVLNPTNGE